MDGLWASWVVRLARETGLTASAARQKGMMSVYLNMSIVSSLVVLDKYKGEQGRSEEEEIDLFGASEVIVVL